MNDQVITILIVLAILYFWNKKSSKVEVSTTPSTTTTTTTPIDNGGEPPPDGGTETDPTGISNITENRLVVDTEPQFVRAPGSATYGPATKFPKVGENINDVGVTFNDMVFPDGSPRILTWSQLASMEAERRILYIHLTTPELAQLTISSPDVIAWTAY